MQKWPMPPTPHSHIANFCAQMRKLRARNTNSENPCNWKRKNWFWLRNKSISMKRKRVTMATPTKAKQKTLSWETMTSLMRAWAPAIFTRWPMNPLLLSAVRILLRKYCNKKSSKKNKVTWFLHHNFPWSRKIFWSVEKQRTPSSPPKSASTAMRTPNSSECEISWSIWKFTKGAKSTKYSRANMSTWRNMWEATCPPSTNPMKSDHQMLGLDLCSNKISEWKILANLAKVAARGRVTAKSQKGIILTEKCFSIHLEKRKIKKKPTAAEHFPRKRWMKQS